MKKSIIIPLLAFAFLGGYAWNNAAHAQAAIAAPWQITVVGAHTLCSPVASSTSYCFASDGLWQSVNGAAFVQVGGVSGSVVTSWNGQTGDIKYTAPVTSVNSKTGAVTLTVQ